MQLTSSKRRSINRQLAWAITLTTVASLLVACLTFIFYDARTGRAALVDRAAMLANVMATNSAVPLAFQDRGAIDETLAGLSAVPDVTAAVVYDTAGTPNAIYAPGEQTGPRQAIPLSQVGYRFGSFDGDQVGSILLRLDTSSLAQRVRALLLIVAVVLAAAGAAGALVARRLQRQIARPLGELIENTSAVTQGDLTRPLAQAGNDEVGALVSSFNAMTVGLRDLVVQVRQSIGAVSDITRVLEERGGSLANHASRQGAAVAESAESVEQVSESIQSVNAHVERLADASHDTSSSIIQLDAAIGEIASHMDQLASAIDTTSSAVTQVTSSISEVVDGAESLQRASDETAERLGDLSSSVLQVKENAAQSHELSQESSREASEGMAAVRETIAAMGEIQASFGVFEGNVSRLAQKSTSIQEIVRVIEGVAEQTSLLSLNAAIIAAQAGEHGRAFSVVAEQVKELADRTHRSAREIADLIADVQQDTESAVSAVTEGVTLVERGVQRSNVAGEVLDRILEKTRSSSERVHQIVEATGRQSMDLERVDRALREVKSIVERINHSSHDQEQATREIGAVVENLRELGSAVRGSIDEQRRGSRLITQAAASVTDMVNQIVEATSNQTKGSEAIQTALQVFKDVTEETTLGADAINTSVASLLERAAHLETKIGRFKAE